MVWGGAGEWVEFRVDGAVRVLRSGGIVDVRCWVWEARGFAVVAVGFVQIDV